MLGPALRLASVWLSPAVLLSLAPLLLADGTHGLWPPLALLAGACLAVTVLGVPWGALRDDASLPGLAAARWPAAPHPIVPLTGAAASAAALFLWAQLAAVGELMHALGGPEAAGIGGVALVLALLAWMERAAARVATVGAALAALGLAVPIGGVMLATDPAWPGVWDAVASRERPAFRPDGPWVREALPVHGAGLPGGDVVVVFGEEQRVGLLGRGPVRVEARDGATWRRDGAAPLEIAVQPGDRLVAPDGYAVRFQSGRAIPGAPRSGAEWVEPHRRPGAGRALTGLGVTLLAGALGLAPVHGGLPAGKAGGHRRPALAAVLVGAGLGTAVLWGLYATWLTPEIHVAGVRGSEVYALPGRLDRLGAIGPVLRDLASVGLLGGGVAAGLAALRGVPGRQPGLRPALAVAAAILAMLVPASPWTLLALAFGLGAAAGAPAAVLAGWGERVTPLGLAAGTLVGLAVFTGLTLVALAGLVDRPDRTWLGWLAAWPALAAAPLNALAAWLVSAASRPPPAPGLDALHGRPAAQDPPGREA
jgi:hypothetical protein